MPDAQGRPFARDIAERIGITQSDWRARVHRQHAPEAVDYVAADGAMRAVWDPKLIDAYIQRREFVTNTRTTMRAAMAHRIECPHDNCDASTTSWAALNAHIRTDHAPERSAS